MNQPRPDMSRMTQDKIDMYTNNSLYLVRSLRARAYRLHQDIFTSVEEKDTGDDMMKRIYPLCIKLNKNYDDLEGSVSHLPEKTTIDKAKLDRLKYLFQEEQIDTTHSELIDKLIRATNYNEGNFQFNSYFSLFMPVARRKNYAMIPHSVSYSKFDMKNNPHALFESLLVQFHKDLTQRRSGILITIIEKNCNSCVFEVRSGCFQQNKKDFVCLQKAVVIENGGSIDKVTFYAPNEELVLMDDFGEKRVDLRVSSRYEVYRRLSINTNIYLLQNAPISDYRSMQGTISWISKVYRAIETPCKVCKKVLKDFIPPTSYSPTNMNQTQHETCR